MQHTDTANRFGSSARANRTVGSAIVALAFCLAPVALSANSGYLPACGPTQLRIGKASAATSPAPRLAQQPVSPVQTNTLVSERVQAVTAPPTPPENALQTGTPQKDAASGPSAEPAGAVTIPMDELVMTTPEMIAGYFRSNTTSSVSFTNFSIIPVEFRPPRGAEGRESQAHYVVQ